MKRSFLFLAIISILSSTFYTSCSNEVEVIGEWKEIPIVYGVFNPWPLEGQAAVHYFRVEKAFLDPKTDAFVIAQRPDSLYYAENEVDVILYQYENGDPCNLLQVDTLTRVRAEDEGLEARDSGIFAADPNILYKTNKLLLNGQHFRLQIKNNVTGNEFNTYTRGIFAAGQDSPGENYNDFSILTPSTSRALKWTYYDEGTSQWLFNDINTKWEEPLNAAIYDLSVILHYDEYEVDGNGAEVPGTREEKTITWNPIKNYIRPGNTFLDERCNNSGRYYNIYSPDNSPAQQELKGENFFNFLASRLSNVSGTNIRRCAGYLDLRVDCAGPELAEYLQARNANQNLIGGLFPVEPFTNIEGGYGVFTTKSYVWKKDFLLDVEVLEYLALPEGITGNLGFTETACY
jgi:hypothetical protein